MRPRERWDAGDQALSRRDQIIDIRHPVLLRYWTTDREAGLACSTSARRWLIEAGLLPAPESDGEK